MNLSEKLVLSLIKNSDASGCIEWPGAKTTAGYPIITVNKKQILATRYAKAFVDEIEIPERSILCRHSCDNPPCINPSHLSWGSSQDNSNDAVVRGRTAKGSGVSSAKMTEATVLEARGIFLSNGSLKEITSKYGLSNNAATQMLTGKTFAHVPGAISENDYKESTRRIIPSDEISMIRNLRIVRGLSWKAIADAMGYGSAMTPLRIYRKDVNDGSFSED